jgi:DNA-binding NarL/FixJ family response regulator
MESKAYIVGPLRLQNQMMARCLETSVGVQCQCCSEAELRPALSKQNGHVALVLWDCIGNGTENLWTGLGVGLNPSSDTHLLVLFNASQDKKFEKEAAIRGVRGVFYKTDPLEIFTRGVEAIIRGELWFSRETLSRFLLEARTSAVLEKETEDPLTPREKEILTIIACGANNGKIADDLCISPHTVKCHIYNIYQKINVSNRLQAALWAAKNL